MNYNILITEAISKIIRDPRTVKEVLSSPQGKKWKSAMDSKIEALKNNDIWVIVQCPYGQKIVGSKWIFKTKRNSDGSIVKYKARFVARGFTQQYGIDYDETFSPTLALSVLRLILALGILYGWKIDQMDTVTAFLNGEVDKEIYGEQPEGYDDKFP